ncbi:PP2C family protein-serine/threonine phosphatase [Nocardia sp. NPDC057440]|uniref:PP2C family protein-serine/threonine phosphatase n=1 Tax=Nocardia sp. NPDC057440 TaxID=3346134 RepID=UPI0036701E78
MHTAVTTAIIPREPVLLTGLAGESVSRRGPRSINADAAATYTDSTVGRTAFVVADGVGDHLLAARAARTVANIAARVGARSGAIAGILGAQQKLLHEFPQEGADSVLVVAVLATGQPNGPCDIAWVGDCRAYRWNGRMLHQITTDHTVAELFRARGLRAAPRLHHLVTTSARTVCPAAVGHAATGSSRGRLLLSTDGVHKRLEMTDIKAILAGVPTAGSAAEALVDNALRSGGTDNATALVVDAG